MVGPEKKRCAVRHVVAQGLGSLRAACRALGLGLSTFYHRPAPNATKAAQEQRIMKLSRAHPTLGYRKITALLREQSETPINAKRVQRIRRQHGLMARRRGSKRRRIEGVIRERRQATQRDEVWSYDFVQDATCEGSRLRILSIIDESTRECIMLRASRNFPAPRVIDSLEEIMICQGRKPAYLRSDNGPEFIAGEVRQWLDQAGIGPRYIEPGSPWENGHVESFHASLRAEMLDRELFYSVEEANVMLEDWRIYYNHQRPHGALNYQPPCHPNRALRSGLRPSAPSPAGQNDPEPVSN